MLKTLLKNYQNTLNYFFDQFDQKKAFEFYNLCINCKGTLVFTGVGKSGIIAEKLAMTLISTGTKALFLPPINALHGDIGIISNKDILICISKSGESKELINLLPYVHQRNVKTVAWVSNLHSKLFHRCNYAIHLPVDKELCPFDLAPTTSTAVQLIFGDVLAMALMKAKKFSLEEYAQNHPAGSIGKKIMLKVEDLMLVGSKVPTCQTEDILSDAILELTEKQCGCVLVIDQNFCLQGVFTDGDLRRAFTQDSKGVLERKMGELMTRKYLFTAPKERASVILSLMQKDPKRWVTIMPVLDQKRLIGLIRMHDIVHAGIA